MLKQDALGFSKAISDLWLMENICDRSADLQMDEKQIRDTRDKVREVLQGITRLCSSSELENGVGPEIRRFETALQVESLRAIAHRCYHLKERILDELALEFYFHVPRVDCYLYGQRDPFGEAVTAKFTAANHEIEQAAKCLALQLPTASVFHLMRAMELAVRRLAKKLNMRVTPQTTWRQLTGNMDALIRGMADRTAKQKQKKNAWEAARINLHHVGSVLRNNTMHPTAVYTQAEGRDIFAAVRVSMNSLCHL